MRPHTRTHCAKKVVIMIMMMIMIMIIMIVKGDCEEHAGPGAGETRCVARRGEQTKS